MWVWRWIRWLCAEVRFYAQGGLCERFLEQLRRDGVVLWDVTVEENGVTASCKASQYRRVRVPARRTGTRVRAVRYRGASVFFRPLRGRIGLLIGGAAAVALYFCLTSYARTGACDLRDSGGMLTQRCRRDGGAVACGRGCAAGTPH